MKRDRDESGALRPIGLAITAVVAGLSAQAGAPVAQVEAAQVGAPVAQSAATQERYEPARFEAAEPMAEQRDLFGG